MNENTQILQDISDKLDVILNKNTAPKLLYAKDIANNYKVNVSKATKLCKEYGTNFGGWCIEEEKFKEILQNEGKQLFENLK
jgi:hypothetical protein